MTMKPEPGAGGELQPSSTSLTNRLKKHNDTMLDETTPTLPNEAHELEDFSVGCLFHFSNFEFGCYLLSRDYLMTHLPKE